MARISLALTLAALCSAGFAAPANAAGDWAWPVRGDVIGTYRNGSDPYAGGQHRGIDIAAPVGRAVGAPVSGRVTFAGTAGSSGLTVSVRSRDGRWDTSYLHLSSVSVREGEDVARGGRLGAVGTTGRRSATQPHLHFGVREAGSRHAYRDPLDFLAPIAGPGEAKPGPVGAPVPLPFRARPGGAPVPAAVRAPARAPSGVPGPAPAPAGALAPPAVSSALAPAALGPAPRAESHRGSAAAREALQAPGQAPEAAPRGEPGRAPAGAPAARSRAPASPDGGFDLGWVLACLGLAGAGLALGKPKARRGFASRFRATALSLSRGWPSTSRPRSTT